MKRISVFLCVTVVMAVALACFPEVVRAEDVGDGLRQARSLLLRGR